MRRMISCDVDRHIVPQTGWVLPDTILGVARFPLWLDSEFKVSLKILQDDRMHRPVLLEESVDLLNIRPGGVYLDATFGCGGHASLILSRLDHQGMLLAVDRDPAAIKLARSVRDVRLVPIHTLFSGILSQVRRRGLLGKIDGILMDLGVSALQLDDPRRGFSFLRDGPLNMSMDSASGMAAANWLRDASVGEITWVLKNFGEERFAGRIAKFVTLENRRRAILSTGRLSDLILRIVPPGGKHPARRSFMAIRIRINDELGELGRFLDDIPLLLSVGGRLAIISFHSLEDRMVKRFIRRHTGECRLKAFRKIKPSPREMEDNPRSRSAILRSAEKLF